MHVRNPSAGAAAVTILRPFQGWLASLVPSTPPASLERKEAPILASQRSIVGALDVRAGSSPPQGSPQKLILILNPQSSIPAFPAIDDELRLFRNKRQVRKRLSFSGNARIAWILRGKQQRRKRARLPCRSFLIQGLAYSRLGTACP